MHAQRAGWDQQEWAPQLTSGQRGAQQQSALQLIESLSSRRTDVQIARHRTGSTWRQGLHRLCNELRKDFDFRRRKASARGLLRAVGGTFEQTCANREEGYDTVAFLVVIAMVTVA